MHFSTLQRLQISWALLGLGFNLVSLALRLTGAGGLAPTNPLHGLIFILVYAAFTLMGAAGIRRPYVFALPVLAAGLAGLGVMPHLSAARDAVGLEGYSPSAAWAAALLINGFGAGVFAVSAWIEISRSAVAQSGRRR